MQKAVMILILIFGFLRADERYTPTLEADEQRFSKSMEYTLADYHFAWDMRYFELVWFYATKDKQDKFALEEEPRLYLIFQSDSKKYTPQEQKDRLYLANTLLNDDYFLKDPQPPFPVFRFSVLNFIDASGRFKAIENRKELLEMLGDIDTSAELLLWIYVDQRGSSTPYSFKKIGDLYRVRFLNFYSYSCDYHEFFKFYDTQGNEIKTQEIKKVHDDKCIPVMI